MAECLGLGCYFYNLGQHFDGEALSEEKVRMRVEHRVMASALSNAGITTAECPFNTKVSVGDISDRHILTSFANVNEPLVSDALTMSPIEEGVTNAA